MRLFIGIDLPNHVKLSLFKSQLRLKKLGVKGSWKAPEDFHITMEFLGDFPPEFVPALIQILNTVVTDKRIFRLHIGNIGAFPSFQRAQVLWAGVGGAVEKLDEIWSELHGELGTAGFSLQKAPFRPHITLLTRPKALVPGLDAFRLRVTGKFIVTELVLFESKVEDRKRVYPHLYCAVLHR